MRREGIHLLRIFKIRIFISGQRDICQEISHLWLNYENIQSVILKNNGAVLVHVSRSPVLYVFIVLYVIFDNVVLSSAFL